MPRPDYRALLLDLFPKNARIAEIGVWKGDFSAQILRTCTPKELHLVDPWQLNPDKIPSGNKNWSSDQIEEIYHNVVSRFAADKRVFIHRLKSAEFLSKAKTDYFDVIYLDGDHCEEAVYKDLCLSWNAITMYGSITGDDYYWGDEQGNHSVKMAVDRFCRERNLRKRRIGNQYLIQKL